MDNENLNQPEDQDETEEFQEGDEAVKENPKDTPTTPNSLKDVLGQELGKEFESDEDALKAIRGFKKLVGDNKIAEDRKKAKEFDKLSNDPAFSEYKDKLDTVMLQNKYPEAVEYVDEIKLISKAKGVDFIKAYEGSKLKELLELKKATDEDTKETINGIPGVAKQSIRSEEKKEITLADAQKSPEMMRKYIRQKSSHVFEGL